MFHGFNYGEFFDLRPGERMGFLLSAMEHVLEENGKKEKFLREVPYF